ncbi:MAG TPA: WYL domain-containing protein [Geminicoccus sp.]|nr:WYL domain-containing protein [Geminicoccus sp.]HEX2527533.1 WYL domain-containing protein [Geminicoccus sp.]
MRTGDQGLKDAASVVQAKLAAILPDHARRPIDRPSLYASDWGVAEPATLDLAMVRRAIRDERKLAIAYVDEAGRETSRMICPIAMIYYVEVINLVAWCELRQAIRHFRADRIVQAVVTNGSFKAEGERLRAAWASVMTARRNHPASPG